VVHMEVGAGLPLGTSTGTGAVGVPTETKTPSPARWRYSGAMVGTAKKKTDAPNCSPKMLIRAQ
jgi:hypothetical protein